MSAHPERPEPRTSGDMQGERLGPYVLETLLGRGGFGEVWKARDEKLSRRVAVKILDARDGDDLKRFAREAQTAASLDHPNIAAVYDVGFDGARPYIAMQLVDGSSPAGPLPPRDAARIVRDAARAVAFAHQAGIIHRDLKPANLLVSRPGSPGGDDGRVYVMDFGLARSAQSPSLTGSGQMIGTPAYMSPEQARGERADARSDVWALGATLHELLAGRPPFAGGSIIDVLTRVVADDPPPLPGAPRELANVVAKCLEKDPRRRYASASDLAADLDRFLRGASVSARTPARFARALARRPAIVIGALAAAVTAALVARSLLSAERGLARRAELRRLDDAIAIARPQFYIADADIRARVAAVEAALEELDRVEPKDAEIWTMIGIGRHVTGDLPGAEAALRRAESLGAADPRLHHALARVLLDRSVVSLLITADAVSDASATRATARMDEALARLDRSAGWGEESERVALTAWRAFARGDHAALEAACNDGLARVDGRPGAEELWLLLGAASSADQAQQIDFMTRALRIRPHDARAHLLRGVARFTLHDYAGCIDDTTRAIAIHPRFAAGYANRASALLRLGRTDEGRAELDRALALDPSHASALGNRASLRIDAGELDAAEQDLEAAFRAAPGWAFAHWTRGRIHRARGRLEDALADATAAVTKRPDVAGMWSFRAQLHYQLGRYDQAAADYGASIARNGRDADAWHGRALSRAHLGDAAGAIEDDSRAIELDPSHAQALAHRGSLRGSLDDLDAAVRLEPGAASYRNRRGALRQAKGDAAGAEEDYGEAARLDPRSATPLYNRGVLRRQQGRAAEALDDLEAAAKLAPQDADVRLWRGLARLDLGRRPEAREDFREALRLAPAAWAHRAQLETLLRELGE